MSPSVTVTEVKERARRRGSSEILRCAQNDRRWAQHAAPLHRIETVTVRRSERIFTSSVASVRGSRRAGGVDRRRDELTRGFPGTAGLYWLGPGRTGLRRRQRSPRPQAEPHGGGLRPARLCGA